MQVHCIIVATISKIDVRTLDIVLKIFLLDFPALNAINCSQLTGETVDENKKAVPCNLENKQGANHCEENVSICFDGWEGPNDGKDGFLIILI